MALKQNSDIVAEHQDSIIGFVWRPEEITPAVMQMAQRTGSRAVFDFSTDGVWTGYVLSCERLTLPARSGISRFLSLPSWIHLWGSY